MSNISKKEKHSTHGVAYSKREKQKHAALFIKPATPFTNKRMRYIHYTTIYKS